MRSLWTLLFLLLACGDDGVAPSVDGGFADVLVEVGPQDGGSDDDFDGDGLCNATESERGTDPLRADTDDDGFPDATEVLLGFNPTMNSSPNRELIYVLREDPTATVQVPIERTLFGRGDDFFGAFSSIRVSDTANQSAGTFYTESVATYVVPQENAVAIDPEREAIFGLDGRSLVGFEVRFAYGDALRRECTRAYPFRYEIKRSDGALVGISRATLVVLPMGETLANTNWCVRTRCF